MGTEYLNEAIKAAQQAAEAASPDMRAKAFEMVLAHLLESKTPAGAPRRSMPDSQQASAAEASPLNIARIAAQLGLPEERVSELYEMKNGKLHVAIRPAGKTLADKQRNLANVLVLGYRLGLDIKEVSITQISEVADVWNIRDGNLGRNLQDSKILQTRGGSGKGKRPQYSLAPNAIDRVRAEIDAMFNSA